NQSMRTSQSAFLVLPAAWLLCILGFRLEQMSRELVINYVLARSLGAPIDGWRMSWAALTTDARTFSLPATAQTLVAGLASLTELSVPAVLGLIEPRLGSCFGTLL